MHLRSEHETEIAPVHIQIRSTEILYAVRIQSLVVEKPFLERHDTGKLKATLRRGRVMFVLEGG